MNCTDPPVSVPNSDKGEYDWDMKNMSYQTVIKYTCPKVGWGYPSNGENEAVNECQADKTWTLDSVETCVCKYLGH